MSKKETIIVYYHANCSFLSLITAAWDKLTGAKAAGELTRFAMQKHWLHGPHLKLHVEYTDGGTVVDDVLSFFQEYLEKNPSETPLLEAEYCERFTLVGGMELEQEEMLPLYPDNTVRRLDFVMKSNWGSGFGSNFAFESLAEILPFFIPIARMPEYRDDRILSMLKLMMAWAFSFEDVSSAANCFRSHAEAYFHSYDTDKSIRQVFKINYENNREIFQREFEAIEQGQDKFYQDFQAPIKKIFAVIAQSVKDSAYQRFDREDCLQWEKTLPDCYQKIPERWKQPSPRHASLYDGDPKAEAFRKLPKIQGEAFSVNILYEALRLVGMLPIERFLLCDITASVFESKFGNWDPDLEAWDGTPL